MSFHRGLELLVLSINPRFARMILRGEKTVELRRRAPRRSTDFWISLYATTPLRAMIGVVRAYGVLVAPPEDLWEAVKEGCGLEREEYWRYYEGASRAVGLQLESPIAFPDPLSLNSLRHWWPGFMPPRSFAYLSHEQAEQIWAHAGLCSIRGAVG
jgi:predicted transcriptional regulator